MKLKSYNTYIHYNTLFYNLIHCFEMLIQNINEIPFHWLSEKWDFDL